MSTKINSSGLEAAATYLFTTFEAVFFASVPPTAQDAQQPSHFRESEDTVASEESDADGFTISSSPNSSTGPTSLSSQSDLPSYIDARARGTDSSAQHSLIEHDLVQRASSHADLSHPQARRRTRSNLQPKSLHTHTRPLLPSERLSRSFSRAADTAPELRRQFTFPSSDSRGPPPPSLNYTRSSSISSMASTVTRSLESWRNSWSSAHDQALAEMEEPRTPREISEARQRALFLLVL
ncbi:MAG: hypothetical protein WDW38_008367 [Sanguina aurantia]